MKDRLSRRILLSGIGILLCGLGVGLMRQADFGVDPFQCFCLGVSNVVPIAYGTLYVVINGLLLSLMVFFARSYIGVTTFINMFLLGYLIDFSQSLLASLFGVPSSLFGRSLYLALGLLVLCVASAFIFDADLGVSTYDWFALRLGKVSRKVPFRLWRIGTDLLCVTIGIALGSKAGVGTVVTAFFMGPAIAFFRRTITTPMLTA